MPDPTYESEESQPAHRPGMEKIVNRTNPDGTKQVSPPTESAFGPASKSDPAPVKAPPPAAPTPAAADSPGSGAGGRVRTQKILSQADDMS